MLVKKLPTTRRLQVRRLLLSLLCGAQLASAPALVQAQADVSLPAVRSANNQLPSLGDGLEMSISAERKIGDRIVRSMYRDPDYIDDPVLVDYVQSIWQPLLAAAKARGDMSEELAQRFAWEILLGRDRQVNAFALPGGYFGLYLGLIATVTSRDELASVLGHELSHVTQRHIARSMGKQGEQMPLILAGLVLAALAASKSPDAASAAIVGGQALAVQNQLNFSRDMEREADRVGFGIMTQAGFAPQGSVSMFDKLQQASRLSDNGDFPYLRSHPLTSERIADMQARQPAGTPAPLPLTLEQAIISARAHVLSNTDIDSLRRTLGEANDPALASQEAPRQAGALYAGALASLRQRDYAAANAFIERLDSLTRDDAAAQRLSRLLRLEVALKSGAPAPVPEGSGRAELLLGSELLVREGNAMQAVQRLQSWVTLHPRDAGAWLHLAAASRAQGLALRALRAEAEAQAAQMDPEGALDRFKAAQSLARSQAASGTVDHFEASIIDTRARQVQAQVQELAREKAAEARR